MTRLLVFAFFITSNAFAAPNIAANNKIIITYGNKVWNQDPSKIDSVTIIVKDNLSKKILMLELQETEPNSAIFKTNYKLNFNADNLTPHIYIPEEKLMNSENNKKEVINLIRDGKISRKPFLFKRSRVSTQSIDIFDNKKQLRRALEAHKKNIVLSDLQKFLLDEEIIQKDEMRNMNNLSLENELRRLSRDEEERSIARVKMILEEKQRIDKLKKKYNNLSFDKKESTKKRSLSLKEEALQLMAGQNHSLAYEKIEQAQRLNPMNNEIYYLYAVSLFNLEKYNPALVSFSILEDAKYNIDEIKYYKAINHYKQAEFNRATLLFSQLKSSSNKSLGSSSAFYLGLIAFQKENYNLAKNEFQFVLDYSMDVNMDKQAESYIENIMQIQQFEKDLETPYTLRLMTGLSQDSNILLVSDGSNTNANAQDDGGLRFNLTTSIERKHIHRPNRQLRHKAKFGYLYSLDDEFSTADTTTFGVSSIYTKPTKVFNSTYRSSFEPGLDLIYLDLENTGTREHILSSWFFKNTNQKVIDANRLKSYDFEYSYNDSEIEVTTADSDSTAHRITLREKNIYYLDKAKGKLFNWDYTFTSNLAKGNDYKYNRVEAGISYIRPIISLDSILSARLNFYHARFASDDDRKDTQISLTTNLIKSLNNTFSLIGNLSYLDNASSVDSKDYDKYMIGLILSSNVNF